MGVLESRDIMLNRLIQRQDTGQTYIGIWREQGDTCCWAHVLGQGIIARAERSFDMLARGEQRALANERRKS